MIYFIYGADSYRAKQKLKELLEKYQVGFELIKIDGEKINLDELQQKIKSTSLFIKQRLMVIENLSHNKEQKEILGWLKTILDEVNKSKDILIFYEEKVDKKTSCYKFFNSKETKIEKLEFEELKPFELKNWVEKYIQSKGGRIEKVALEELLMNNKSDLWFLTGELDKLLAYNKQISLANVQLLTSANFDDNIFSLADAVGRGDKTTALELINRQLEAGAAAIYLLSMIIRQFRILIQIKDALQRNNNYNLIAQELSLHPFVVQKTMLQAQRYSFPQLQEIYTRLQALDLKLKSSKISPEVLFTVLIVN